MSAKGLGLDAIAAKAVEVIGIDADLKWFRTRQPEVIQARSLLGYRATHELGISQSDWSILISYDYSNAKLLNFRAGSLRALGMPDNITLHRMPY